MMTSPTGYYKYTISSDLGQAFKRRMLRPLRPVGGERTIVITILPFCQFTSYPRLAIIHFDFHKHGTKTSAELAEDEVINIA